MLLFAVVCGCFVVVCGCFLFVFVCCLLLSVVCCCRWWLFLLLFCCGCRGCRSCHCSGGRWILFVEHCLFDSDSVVLLSWYLQFAVQCELLLLCCVGVWINDTNKLQNKEQSTSKQTSKQANKQSTTKRVRLTMLNKTVGIVNYKENKRKSTIPTVRSTSVRLITCNYAGFDYKGQSKIQ